MPSPSAEARGLRRSTLRRRLRRLAPRTFQARLTIGFVGIVALTLVLVSVLVLNRLDNFFYEQQRADLETRAQTVALYAASAARESAEPRPVVYRNGLVDPAVIAFLDTPSQRQILADRLGQADVRIEFGRTTPEGFDAASNGRIVAPLLARPRPGQSREPTSAGYYLEVQSQLIPYGIQVTLSNPYTSRAMIIANVASLLAAVGLLALGLSVIVAAALARRSTTPLRRLTEASRSLAEGDLSSRVPLEQIDKSPSELRELAVQFNAMAERLEESVTFIRRDRDRSRDFLADVSHELRTPIAALRTFNELLKQQAGADPAARAEFLESSGQQIERLDWLAQNLLELSKLDSGLLLLELRPDDLRAAIESSAEQADAAARKRGVELVVRLPDSPIRIRHDPQRVGQVVGNLVGNAIKFTPRGGRVTVEARAARDGAIIEVTDTGVGIDPAELPHIFERFYRGSIANEARGSGSGLGLAIVQSIVEMHGGSVAVESRLGAGSRFTVRLPRDPRDGEGEPSPAEDERGGGIPDPTRREAPATAAAPRGNMTETSPGAASGLNTGASR
jgi:two-component system, OmpR family, sensor histidine kinase BaeS